MSALEPSVFGKCIFWGIDRAANTRSEKFRFARDLSLIPGEQPLLVIANELFDALPFARLVKRPAGLSELMVVDCGEKLEWEERAAPQKYVDYFDRRDIELQDGQFADVSLQWSELFATICNLSSRALIVTFDYGFPQRQLFDARFRRFGTAAAYYRHQVSRELLARPGEQDLTAHINFSDLIEAGKSLGYTTLSFLRQAEFLLAVGITEHPLFAPADELAVDSLSRALELREQREAARRMVLPDGIGEDLRVLVMARGVPMDGWSFQRSVIPSKYNTEAL